MPVYENNELSEREREILRLVATGASNKEIARALFISANTVKVHLRNIFAKIGAATRTEAALYAVRMGIAEADAASKGAEKAESFVSAEEYGLTPTSINVSDDRRGIHWKQWVMLVSGLLVLILLGAGGLLIRQSMRSVAGASQPPATAYPRWKEHAGLPTARQGLAAVAYGENIYAIGGETAHGVVGVVERYDPAEDAWESRSPKPVPVADIAAAVVGGLIYVPGGRLASGQPVDVLEAYDPLQDRWERRADLPVALSAYALASFEGRLFLFGGWDGSQYVNTVYEYDPTLDRWIERTPMPTRRGFAGAAEATGSIYVIGGYDGQSALTVNESYDPNQDDGQQNPWSLAKPLPEGRFAMGMTSVADIIHILGGEGDPGGDLIPLEFFPYSNEWVPFESPITQSWSRLSLVPLETYLYLIGGLSADRPVDRNLSYKAIFTVLFPEIH